MNPKRGPSYMNLIKAGPLVLILVFFYLHDFLQWYAILFSPPWLAVTVFALSISIFGAVTRRKLISDYADLAVGNWYLGIFFLLSGFVSYFYGIISTTPYLVWAEFESLLFFVLSYISISYDWRILRTIGLLFLIMGLSLPWPGFTLMIAAQSTYYVTLLAMLLLFFIFAGRNFRLIIAPLIAYVFAFLYFSVSGLEGIALFSLIPLSFVISAYPILRHKQSNVRGTDPMCDHLQTKFDKYGFCLSCGKKCAASSKVPRMGLAGLVLIFIVLLSFTLPLIQIPVLQLHNGSTPQYNIYNHQGVTITSLPIAPQGWLTNSSSALTLSGDIFASKSVYVPTSNPNERNYTLYYELSQSSQTNMSNSWGNKVGWSRIVTPMGLGGLYGSLTIYTPSNVSSGYSTLIVYSGREQLVFFQSFSEKILTIQMSFTRNFSSSVDIRTAATEFVSDLQNNWQGQISQLNFASSWSRFLFSIYSLFHSIYDIVVIIASSSLVTFASYKAMQSDSRTDRFLETASDLDDSKWRALSSIIGPSPKTELEMEKLLPRKASSKFENIPILLEEFERLGLLRQIVWEREHEVLLGWRTTI